MRRLQTPAAILLAIFTATTQAQQNNANPTPVTPTLDSLGLPLPAEDATTGSTYIPLDNWIYPAIVRLQGLGYADSAFLGLRPWTRVAVANILAETADKLATHPNDQAWEILLAVAREITPNLQTDTLKPHTELESLYLRLTGISGTPLRDGFHVGQTIVNDYGRPYAKGFNDVAGFTTRTEAGRFSLYVRAEQQHTPATPGYTAATAQILSNIDQVPYGPNQATIPQGPIDAENHFRILNANASVHLIGHEFSFGKSDEWFGPAQGGGMAWSNNAEPIYAFRANRIDPLYVPGLSKLTGPFRWDFLVGSLKGHTEPNSPWVHGEKVSFKPTRNLEIGFERTAIWGGKGHVPITLHSFFKSFFSFQNTTLAEKLSRNDPGARFGAFDFSWRLPGNYLTLYSDSEAHDDVSPASAPRRAAIRPGLYLSRFPPIFPAAAKLDFRIEAVSSDPPTSRSNGGQFNYVEFIQRQGYTNKGQLFGDWIGREAKGGQAWFTYHLSPNEWLQLSYRTAKAPKDFIPGGTTQHDITVQLVKRLGKQVEFNAWVQTEQWRAPLLKAATQTNTTTAVQFTWFPRGRTP